MYRYTWWKSLGHLIEGSNIHNLIFTYARHSKPLSSEVSLTYHTYCDTSEPLIMVISEDLRHSHLLQSVWQVELSQAVLTFYLWKDYQGCFVPSLLEIGLMVFKRNGLPVVLENLKIFKFRRYNLPISLFSPLWKRRGPSFEQSWIPFTKGWYVSNLMIEIGSVVLEKKTK